MHDFLINKLGHPESKEVYKHMALWYVPEYIRAAIPCMPKRIYCYKKLPEYLENGLKLVIIRGLANEIKTWDGCYNKRYIRGLEKQKIWSVHSWACAFDINQNENKLGETPKLPLTVVACFDGWFDWGGYFKGKRVDGMHFQLKREFI